MTVVIQLDRRRRTEQAHFDQQYQTLAGCLETLRAIHTDSATQSARLAQHLNELRLGSEAQAVSLAEAFNLLSQSVETGASSAAESSRALSNDSVRAIEQAATRLDVTLVRVADKLSELDATLVRVADKLSESAAAQSKELLVETQRTTKAVAALKASLEESVRFDKP
jgi:hypothetical protein